LSRAAALAVAFACASAISALWGNSASARDTASAVSGPPATLKASFAPERLGSPTTLSFAVSIDPPPASGPLPLAAVTLSYPSDLGLATSGLGLATCEPRDLEADEAEACPPDSKMGEGNALVEVPFGPTIVRETASLEIYAAPSTDGYIHLAILAHGAYPVLASVVMTGVLRPGRLAIEVPPIPSLPDAPYVSLVNMHALLGGALTYYERVDGRTVSYHPRGIGLPVSCPHAGWRFGASFTFTTGQSSHANTTVPCPRRPRQ
jgi:hypothetical protein